MKPLDLFLLSIAIGLTSFTVYVFGTDTSPAAALEEALPPEEPPRNPSFTSIVLHHSATHGGSAAAFDRTHRSRLGGLAYHFVIGNGSGSEDGAVEIGYRWRDQIPGPHTKNQDANMSSIAVCLVGDLQAQAPTEKQLASLLGLLEKLCRERRIAPSEIRSHREVDPETLCPGRGLPMEAIRELLGRRLGASQARLSR